MADNLVKLFTKLTIKYDDSGKPKIVKKAVKGRSYAHPAVPSDDEALTQTDEAETQTDEPTDDEDYENETSDKKSYPFYVHIDIAYGCSPNLAAAINSYMVQKYYFDPRRGTNFTDDVLGENEGRTLRRMRGVIGRNATYYELWKVKADFDLAKFFDHFARHPKKVENPFRINICVIMDNEHSLYSRAYQQRL